MKITYLFTTFPELSETFYQREIRALKKLGAELQVYSLWGGEASFEGLTVNRFEKWRLFSLLWWVPVWCACRPRTAVSVFRRLFGSAPPSALNLMETLLGLGFAVIYARRIDLAAAPGDVLHAAWATAPGTAAQLIRALTGRRFSQGAHAYDVFRKGGDWWLDSKLRDASVVITSTDATRAALVARGACPSKVHTIRRGLNELPVMRTPRHSQSPCRFLSVGRLVEKKGYPHLLKVFAALRARGAPFSARIVGDGPMADELKAQIAELGLDSHVSLLGALPYDQTMLQYQWADLFLFTGIIAASGDRDGLPNVVPEAMAAGVPVIASPVSGVPEAICHRQTGLLLDAEDTDGWVAAIGELLTDSEAYQNIRQRARAWVEREFDATTNARRLCAVWQSEFDEPDKPGQPS